MILRSRWVFLKQLYSVGKAETLKAWRQGRIAQLAEILNVSPSALMGWDNASNAATETNELKLDNTYLRLARGAQELGLDDDDVDAILAIYKKHKQKNS